jgi:hypothetical protein
VHIPVIFKEVNIDLASMSVFEKKRNNPIPCNANNKTYSSQYLPIEKYISFLEHERPVSVVKKSEPNRLWRRPPFCQMLIAQIITETDDLEKKLFVPPGVSL